MIQRILSVFFLLILFSCDKNPENPLTPFELEISQPGVFGSTLWFEIQSSPTIQDSDLDFFIGSQQVFPQKLANGTYEVSIAELDAGVHLLKARQKSNPENMKQKPFEKAEFLLELRVDESFLSEDIRHFLLVWDEEGNSFLEKEILETGNIRIPMGEILGTEFSFGIFSRANGFEQGLGQIFKQVPFGKSWPLKVDAENESPFGSANLKFRNIPSHQEYWIGNRGGFSHGTSLSANFAVFLDYIPSRFFLRLNQGERILGKFFQQQATLSGASLDFDLSQLQELNSLTISLSKSVSGSFSAFGFENPNNLQSQYYLQVDLLEDQDQVTLADYAEFFPWVEFQLTYFEQDSQTFSRFRGEEFEGEIELFTGDFSLQAKNETDYLLNPTGDLDLVYSIWFGASEPNLTWLVFQIQDPHNNTLQAPAFSGTEIQLEGLSLGRVLVEESDLLEDYQDFLRDFSLGKSHEYFDYAERFHSKMKNPASARVLVNPSEELNQFYILKNHLQ
ncbi:hypothetical protein [Algoriphagus sp. CAU 1675]|uniref:hypothetical protein n=1 Tax=Algoriphagus sp. CAU 1675 TaxID=3032597 RepID=UPI0023DAC57D|nr:hypothetical protein [Algoriphagus sp. CAU 1675]MDF2157047.1 hypothetical protein [Algoriphagus sp. CAU 1675]